MKKFKLVISIFFLSMFLLNAQETHNSKKLNILFIAVDDLKPLISVYGETQMHTPNMDRLAEMGVLFKNAHVQQAVCGPSRASVMTAMYPDHTRVWDLHTNFRESSPNLISMPEYLISQGYETTGIGKIYHKGSTSPGHDEKSWSIPHVIPDDFDPIYGDPLYNYQNPETKENFVKLEAKAIAKGLKKRKLRAAILKELKPSTESANVSDEAYQDGVYTKEAIKKLKMLQENEKPFFLGVGYQKPHLPFVAPKKYWDLYKRDEIQLAEFQELAIGTPSLAYHSFGELRSYTDIDSSLTVGDKLPESKQKELIHGYMASVSFIDAQIGKLLNTLDELKLNENTLIVLWGDHGYHLGDHTEWCKHSNFEQATRIPLLFSGPGIDQNQQINTPVNLVDVFPTLFDLSNVQIPSNLDGKSLKPLFDNDDSTNISVDYAISQYPRQKDKMGYSIRTERYRYTEWHGNGYKSFNPYNETNIVAIELYDYLKDPNETRNLVNDEIYKKDVVALKQKLKDHLTREFNKN